MFLSFHMLQRRKENFLSNMGLREDLTLRSASSICWQPSGENCIGNHWCWLASSQTFLPVWHSVNICSIVSMSPRQVGQPASIFSLRFSSVPRVGNALWQIFHRKILIFSMVSISQIHLKGQSEWSFIDLSCAFHVADLVVKVPELVKPQHKGSGWLWIGMTIPLILWMIRWSPK